MVISEPALPLVVVWLSLACVAGHALPVKDVGSGVDTDCCSRTPAKTSPVTTTALPFTTTTAPDTHKLECEHHEIQRTACLNGGTCFALILEGAREAFCNCPEEWRGNRCQEAELPFVFYSTQRMKTANIAAGAAIAVVFVVVVILCLYVFIRYKKRIRAFCRRWRKKQSRMENFEFEEQAQGAIRGSKHLEGNGYGDELNVDLFPETEVDIHNHRYNNAHSDNRNGPQKPDRTATETTV